MEYEVSWTMIYEADDPEDAVRQALAALGDVVAHPSEGPNIFVVTAPGVLSYRTAEEALEARKNDGS